MELDIDEPSIEALQTLMLLSQATFQTGKGKKTFMLLSMYQVLRTFRIANLSLKLRRSAWPSP